jgi:hypothetical protein
MDSMTSGEILTRATIWVAMVGYGAGAVTFALSRQRAKWESATRWLWTIACCCLIAHVAAAFNFYHAWSHTDAYNDTRRQTEEVVGLSWGGGLYINYLLLAGWVVDLVWWWLGGLSSYRHRPWLLLAAWHSFLLFIIFNATVVFKTGSVRWAGLALCLLIGSTWWILVRGRQAYGDLVNTQPSRDHS